MAQVIESSRTVSDDRNASTSIQTAPDSACGGGGRPVGPGPSQRIRNSWHAPVTERRFGRISACAALTVDWVRAEEENDEQEEQKQPPRGAAPPSERGSAACVRAMKHLCPQLLVRFSNRALVSQLNGYVDQRPKAAVGNPWRGWTGVFSRNFGHSRRRQPLAWGCLFAPSFTFSHPRHPVSRPTRWPNAVGEAAAGG
jgi:hypothetical protein